MISKELVEEFRKKFAMQLVDMVCWLATNNIKDTITFHSLGTDVIFKPESDDDINKQ